MLAGFPLSAPANQGVPGPAVGSWSMAAQVSTNGALIDYSGNGHHGWYGGVKKALLADTTTGVRALIFNSVASNTVTLAGLANSTTYDMTITYHDDTTDTHELTTSGAGVMTFAAATDAKFTNKQVKTIVIVPDGGGATVDTVDFTARAQGTRSFTTAGGRTVTVNQAGTSTAEPTNLWYSGTVYVWLPGTTGNYFSVPDEAALDITGDIDIRADVALNDWTPSAANSLISKLASDPNQHFGVIIDTAGKPRFRWSPDGTDASKITEAGPSSAVPLSDGARGQIRVVRVAATGAVSYSYRTDGLISSATGWTSLGADVAGTAGNLAAGTAVLSLGGDFAGASSQATGKFYAAQIYSGIAGTKVLDIDFTAAASYNATRTTLTAVSGQSVTINRSATGLKTAIVTENVALFDGVDDYISIDDHARLDFAETESLTAAWVGRVYGTNADLVYVAKKADLTTAAGWSLDRGTANAPEFTLGDGTNTCTDVSGALTQGQRTVVVGVRRVANDNIEAYTAGVGSGTPTTDNTTATLANSGELRIGRLAGAGTAYNLMEFVGAALYRRALSPAQIQRLNTEL